MLNAEKKASLNYSLAYIYNVTDHKLDIYTKYNIYTSIDNAYIMNSLS